MSEKDALNPLQTAEAMVSPKGALESSPLSAVKIAGRTSRQLISSKRDFIEGKSSEEAKLYLKHR